jgi:hypothetical protein
MFQSAKNKFNFENSYGCQTQKNTYFAILHLNLNTYRCITGFTRDFLSINIWAKIIGMYNEDLPERMDLNKFVFIPK